jgi:hypothetical protein
MELRHILHALLFIGGACVAIANLSCALAYGEVFLTHGQDWAGLDVSPVRFFTSAAASLVLAPFLIFMGVFAMKNARDERRFRKGFPHVPRFADDSKVSGP